VSNELALLVIFLVWLKNGRGVNLCLLIVFYYFLYEISQRLTVNIPQIYFTSQILVDITILFSCLLLAYKNTKQSFILLMYAVIVFSSLAVEGLRLVDEVSSSYALIDLYDLRQGYSHALDLIFAVLGSGRGELINDIGLSIRGSRVYNRIINLKATIQSYKL
jgi:hypothetical protein